MGVLRSKKKVITFGIINVLITQFIIQITVYYSNHTLRPMAAKQRN